MPLFLGGERPGDAPVFVQRDEQGGFALEGRDQDQVAGRDGRGVQFGVQFFQAEGIGLAWLEGIDGAVLGDEDDLAVQQDGAGEDGAIGLDGGDQRAAGGVHHVEVAFEVAEVEFAVVEKRSAPDPGFDRRRPGGAAAFGVDGNHGCVEGADVEFSIGQGGSSGDCAAQVNGFHFKSLHVHRVQAMIERGHVESLSIGSRLGPQLAAQFQGVHQFVLAGDGEVEDVEVAVGVGRVDDLPDHEGTGNPVIFGALESPGDAVGVVRFGVEAEEGVVVGGGADQQLPIGGEDRVGVKGGLAVAGKTPELLAIGEADGVDDGTIGQVGGGLVCGQAGPGGGRRRASAGAEGKRQQGKREERDRAIDFHREELSP